MKKGYVVPTSEKFAYGIGDLAINIGFGAVSFHMLYFLVNGGGLDPGKAGIIILLAKFWDAFSDYIMGRISDKTKSKWGRRRPYIIFGAIPMGLAFAVMWFIPFSTAGGMSAEKVETLRFFYYLVTFILFNTAFTVVAVPYNAMLPEMTKNYNERSSLAAFKTGSSFVGTLFAAAGAMFLTDFIFKGFGKSVSYPAMGFILGAMIAGILFITGFKTKERFVEQNVSHENLFKTLVSFFKMKEFRLVIGMFLFNMIGLDVIMAVIEYYLKDVIKLDGDLSIAFMALPLVAAVLASPLWVIANHKFGKKKSYIIAAAYFILAMLVAFFVPEGSIAGVTIVSILSGVGISACQVIPWSVLPDIIEIDEYKNGIRREGAFYGIVTFLYKLASAIAILIVGYILQVAKYQKPDIFEHAADYVAPVIVQPDSAILAIRLILGVLPGIFFLASLIFMWMFPVGKKEFDNILNELDKRKASGETINE